VFLGLVSDPYFWAKRRSVNRSTLVWQTENIHTSNREIRISQTMTKRPRKIVYHAFSVEIVGPRFRTKAARRKIRKILSRKFLKEIEEACGLAAKKKLPAGFRVRIN
jgi:hypothetical protein